MAGREEGPPRGPGAGGVGTSLCARYHDRGGGGADVRLRRGPGTGRRYAGIRQCGHAHRDAAARRHAGNAGVQARHRAGATGVLHPYRAGAPGPDHLRQGRAHRVTRRRQHRDGAPHPGLGRRSPRSGDSLEPQCPRFGPSTATAQAHAGPCAVPKPCARPDLLLYARRSCSFASSTCSWSGCSAGWRYWRAVTPPRMRRSSCCAMRSRSCAGRSRAQGRTGLTVPYSPHWPGCCPGACGCTGS
jgi:hypothetical protein